jgi:hypothetical protein
MLPVQLCRGFTDEQWNVMRPRLDQGCEAAWACTIEVFERRVKQRYTSCIEALFDADSREDVGITAAAPPDYLMLPQHRTGAAVVPGFAVMALCCLVIETLQGFSADCP